MAYKAKLAAWEIAGRGSDDPARVRGAIWLIATSVPIPSDTSEPGASETGG